MKNNEVVVLGHNDLDQLGCMLNIECALPNTPKVYYHTNYRDLKDKVQDVMEYIRGNFNELLIITDVSFAETRDLLEELLRLPCKVLYFDHHVYPDGFFDGLNMTYVHDEGRSATKIVHDWFEVDSKNLNALTELINSYDLWLTNNEHFRASMELNDYFWTQDIGFLFDKIVHHDYKLPSDYLDTVKRRNQVASETIQGYYSRGLIHTDNTTTIAFVDEFFNNILLDEFKRGVKVFIVANSYGVIRVRFNQYLGDELTEEVRQNIKTSILNGKNIGHLNAFAVKLEHNSFENIMREIKRISNIIKHRLK